MSMNLMKGDEYSCFVVHGQEILFNINILMDLWQIFARSHIFSIFFKEIREIMFIYI